MVAVLSFIGHIGYQQAGPSCLFLLAATGAAVSL